MSDVKPYYEVSAGKKEQVTQMFDKISGNYDNLNRVITFGMDVGWRKNVFKIVKQQQPKSILDIATGTGDMAILYSKTNADKIVGLDISTGMLEVARQKTAALKLEDVLEYQLGDAENLHFDTQSFDAVTVTYGIRNFEDLEKGLFEILRVLNPGGTLVVLETSIPDNFLLRQGYYFHTKVLLPIIGRLFSTDKKAYSYLSESAHNFPYGEKLKLIFEKVGFKSVEIYPQMGGVSTIYKATKSIS